MENYNHQIQNKVNEKITRFLQDKKTEIPQDIIYTMPLSPEPYQPLDSLFKCRLQNMDTYLFAFLNSFYIHNQVPLTVFPDGSIFGSLSVAKQQYPDLVNRYYAQTKSNENTEMQELNSETWQDGFFVYIPENVHFQKTIQWINLVKSPQNLYLSPRNLIILESHAKLALIHCDDSLDTAPSFINGLTEIILQEGSELSYYKTENKDPKSVLINHLNVEEDTYAHFNSITLTYNAGFVSNELTVNLNRPFSECTLYGSYLLDKKQYAENMLHINHWVPDCKSYQLYKGVLDDAAVATFNGHIYVAQDAQRTEAYQSNRNICLTDDAKIRTRPFLEIYADDVKCSHGASVGQLDEDAMYYLRTRGISKKSAKTLLMYAFVKDVINHVEIASLRDQLNDMVKKRLSGELNHCQHCVLHCSNDTETIYEIDLEK